MAIDGRCRIVALFCYILCLHSLAIFFFTRGFLLTRTELSEFSTCSDMAKSPCFGETPGAVSSEEVNRKHEEAATFSSHNDSSFQSVGGELLVSLDFSTAASEIHSFYTLWTSIENFWQDFFHLWMWNISGLSYACLVIGKLFCTSCLLYC